MSDWFSDCAERLKALSKTNCFEIVDLVIFGFRIRLYFQKASELQRFKFAFAQLFPADEMLEPDLRLYCLDQVGLNELPTPRYPVDAFDQKGHLTGLPEHQHLKIDDVNAVLHATDIKASWGVFCVNKLTSLARWYYYSPLREQLHFWCLSKGFLLIHTGSIVHHENGFLLLGQGGVGKSTTTITALGCGFKTCGDDYLLISPNTGMMQTLYRTLKHSRHPEFPRPTCLANQYFEYDPSTNKDTYFADDVFVSTSRIKAMLLVSQKSHGLGIEASPTEAVAQGAFSSIAQIPIGANQFLYHFKQLLLNKPCLHFGVGQGKTCVLRALDQLKEFEVTVNV